MRKKVSDLEAQRRLQEMRESLPELERQLDQRVAEAMSLAGKINRARSSHPSKSKERANIAAESRAPYGKSTR